MTNLAWELSVFFTRWRIRFYYAAVAPLLYRNWWEVFLFKFRSDCVVLELRDGTRFRLRPNTTDLSVVNEATCLDPYLKPGFVHLKPDSTVVDIGANIGDFTIRAAKLCPQGHVYAVEPILENCESIRQQLQLNHINNVTVLHLALGDHEGEIEIHNEGSQSSSHWGEGPTEQVRLSTLETMLRENNIAKIDLLKMDCEGAEWDILPGAVELLPKIDQLCLEYHNGKLTSDWLKKWLQENRYNVRNTPGDFNGLVWAWR